MADESIAPRWEFFPHTLARRDLNRDVPYLERWRSAKLSYARGDERVNPDGTRIATNIG
jgi:hypothetical protein